MDGLQWNTLLKWMIWGYHYFRKHPYSDLTTQIIRSVLCHLYISLPTFALHQLFCIELAPDMDILK